MAMETVHMKVSGLMGSFCAMSLEKGLTRDAGVKSMMVNPAHGIVLIEADICPRSAGRSVLQGPALLQRCHDEYRNDR
jgi:hypothetical protein